MLIYTLFGNPDNNYWSAAYFISTHLTLLLLFKQYKTSFIRLTGISLNISILIFIIIKFFGNININRWYNIVPFTICIIGIIHYENIKYKKCTK